MLIGRRRMLSSVPVFRIRGENNESTSFQHTNPRATCALSIVFARTAKLPHNARRPEREAAVLALSLCARLRRLEARNDGAERELARTLRGTLFLAYRPQGSPASAPPILLRQHLDSTWSYSADRTVTAKLPGLPSDGFCPEVTEK